MLSTIRMLNRCEVTVGGWSYLFLSCNPPPGSSTDVSEDWEKDFDLDMTEEEVQMALSTVEASGEVGPTMAYIITTLNGNRV